MDTLQNVDQHVAEFLESPEMERLPTTDDVYQKLKDMEELPPDMSEEIPVASLKNEDPEFSVLLHAGVSEDELRGGRVAREKLLRAGFIFNNKPLPGIEKPLINISFDGVDWGKRSLLTQEELNKVVTYQREHAEEFGDDTVASDELRSDILQYLLATREDILPESVARKVNFLRLCIDRMYQERGGSSPKDRARKVSQSLVNLYISKYPAFKVTQQMQDNSYNRQKMVAEKELPDIMVWGYGDDSWAGTIKSRGLMAKSVYTRLGKLAGTPSPFLDSGFHIPDKVIVKDVAIPIRNMDFTVQKPNGLFRVNMLVWHLASRGVSEMGDGKARNGEQDYAIGNYLRHLAPQGRDSSIEKKEQEHFKRLLTFDEDRVVAEVIDRLEMRAREWAVASGDPEATRLLSDLSSNESEERKVPFRRVVQNFFRRLRS